MNRILAAFDAWWYEQDDDDDLRDIAAKAFAAGVESVNPLTPTHAIDAAVITLRLLLGDTYHVFAEPPVHIVVYVSHWGDAKVPTTFNGFTVLERLNPRRILL